MNACDETRKCSRCGAPQTADAPEGLCPRCLMALNLEDQTAEFGTGTQAFSSGLVVLTLAEIAQAFPQFEIVEFLGRGGMGLVYKARQPRLDRFIALKILAPDPEKRGHFAERFQREAQALAKLNHPNIVAVHDFGESGGLYFLAMEFVDGVNLRELLQTEQVAAEQALSIVPSICDALQFAHSQGIVHRDIKPENILIDKQGRVKIADFGIAKILGAEPAKSLTGDRQSIGTPHYMAPEQVEKPTTVDHRADIYSLGVVFYEMLTGELPLGKFQSPSQKVRVDVRLDEIVLRALEKEPERRYQQVRQVKTDLETVTSSPATPFSEARPSPNLSAGPWTLLAKHLLQRFGLMVLAAVILAEAFAQISGGWKESEQERWLLPAAGLWIAMSVWGAWPVFRGRPMRLKWLAGAASAVLIFLGLWVSGVLYGGLRTFLARQISGNRYPTPGLVVQNATSPRSSHAASGTALSSLSVPPVVIATFPESGRSDVDPALGEIRVTFSKVMDADWSALEAAEPENYPQTGQLRLETDHRTFVLPLKLRPGHVYGIWLNKSGNRGFKSVDGVRALPYLLIFRTKD
jgi:serine/threonine protein kinase